MLFTFISHRSLVAAMTLALTPALWADEGHSHDAPAAATGTALPRFHAVSDDFELVGVLQGKQLTLYLDHAADNRPVKNATLELELGALKLRPAPHGGDGEFEVTLAEELKPGTIPVTVTVSAGEQSDLLAGELDLHGDEPTHADAAALGWKAWAGGALIATAVAAVLLSRRARHQGAAA
jgi:hypothetical protein